VGIAHLAVQLGLGNQGGDGINDQHVDGAGAHESFGDLQCLLARVGLRNQQVVDVHAQFFGVGGVEGVLGIDKSGQAAQLLRLGDDLQADGRLARGFGAEDLADAAAGDAADAQSRVEADGAGGDHGNRDESFFGAETDNRPFSKLFFDLCKGKFYGFAAVIGDCHGGLLKLVLTGAGSCLPGRGSGAAAWNSFRRDCSRARQTRPEKNSEETVKG